MFSDSELGVNGQSRKFWLVGPAKDRSQKWRHEPVQKTERWTRLRRCTEEAVNGIEEQGGGGRASGLGNAATRESVIWRGHRVHLAG